MGGGRDLDDYMMKLLIQSGSSFNTIADNEIVRDVKEHVCYVAPDFDEEMKGGGQEKTYTLPNGQALSVGTERFRVPEVLFQPGIIGKELPGIHETIFKSIVMCDVDVRN